MSDHYLDNLLPDFGEFSPDAFLDDYQNRTQTSRPAQAQEGETSLPGKNDASIARRSREIVLQALSETFLQHQKAQRESSKARDQETETEAQPPAEAEQHEAEASQQPTDKKHPVHVSEDGVITLELELPEDEEPFEEEEEEEDEAEEEEEDEESESPAEKKKFSRLSFRKRAQPSASGEEHSLKDRLLTPIARRIAIFAARKDLQRAEAARWPDPEEVEQSEEVSPDKAWKFYTRQMRPLRFRLHICVFLSLLLAWISLGLPMAGILGSSLQVQAGVSLVLLMTVMIAALDIVGTGIGQLLDLHPGGECLAVLSALFSAVDALLVALDRAENMPFCAVAAFSLTAALWAEKLECTGRARTMRMVSISKTPSVLTLQKTSRGGYYLCRTQQNLNGVVHRTEAADNCRRIYDTASPFLLAAALLLSLAACITHRSYFLHTFSALLAATASFSSFLSFPLPYSRFARKLQLSGGAVAGYAGCEEIGRSSHIVLVDEDLFPPGNIKFNSINIQDGAKIEKVVASTASLIAASGSGTTGLFLELMERRKYSLLKLEEFHIHEGGGLSARVSGEQVLVGSAGFMNLMGIRLPQNMVVKNAICTAISGELVGVFILDYVPVSSVQQALLTLLSSRMKPVFAIRDFNITPQMIQQLFRLPAEEFTFPPFRDRYRIAGLQNQPGELCAVLSRPGMGPLVDVADAGRKLYTTSRLGTILSLLGTAAGMLVMFLLFRAGSYDTATAGNVLIYMLLWTFPVAFLSLGQSR